MFYFPSAVNEYFVYRIYFVYIPKFWVHSLSKINNSFFVYTEQKLESHGNKTVHLSVSKLLVYDSYLVIWVAIDSLKCV